MWGDIGLVSEAPHHRRSEAPCVGCVAQKIRSTSTCWSPTCPLLIFNQFQFKIKKDDSLLEKVFLLLHKFPWNKVHTNVGSRGHPLVRNWTLDWASQRKHARKCGYTHITYSSSRRHGTSHSRLMDNLEFSRLSILKQRRSDANKFQSNSVWIFHT